MSSSSGQSGQCFGSLGIAGGLTVSADAIVGGNFEVVGDIAVVGIANISQVRSTEYVWCPPAASIQGGTYAAPIAGSGTVNVTVGDQVYCGVVRLTTSGVISPFFMETLVNCPSFDPTMDIIFATMSFTSGDIAGLVAQAWPVANGQFRLEAIPTQTPLAAAQTCTVVWSITKRLFSSS